ncbi:MAG: ECF transporter S component [Anaerolineae bacterium]|nr:ECF transporter S component [Anaerolineae bacterium]
MPQDRTRKIVIAGVLGAISALLGWTHWGFIPWIGGAALTIMHVPVIAGAVLEGPWVGLAVGVIFGGFSMLQAAIAPTGPSDVLFTNPLIALLPRLAIGPLAWLAWRALQKKPVPGLAAAGVVGSLTNTVLVLGMIGLLGKAPWGAVLPLVVTNGLPEAVASALITLVVVAAWWQIPVGERKGADL